MRKKGGARTPCCSPAQPTPHLTCAAEDSLPSCSAVYKDESGTPYQAAPGSPEYLNFTDGGWPSRSKSRACLVACLIVKYRGLETSICADRAHPSGCTHSAHRPGGIPAWLCPLADRGHGTHVSGTIGAAGNNGVGVVGVAWQVSLYICKHSSTAG